MPRFPRPVAAVLLLAALSAPPRTAAAQAPEAELDPDRPRVGCLRGQPLPHCSSFWVLEVQGILPLVQSGRMGGHADDPSPIRVWDRSLEWNLGLMFNTRGERWAFGPILSVGTQASQPLSGVRARARRWLSDEVSLEAGAGWVFVDPGGLHAGDASGISADLRLNLRDHGSIFVRWDRTFVDPATEFGRYTRYDAGGTQDALLAGAGFGSVPALVTSGILGFAMGLVIAAYLTST